MKKLLTNRFFLIFILLLVLIFLRIPNFYEPYWYGDEAIYLSVGNGMNNNLTLYTDIVDHKTPIIYYLARTPDQLSFRFLNLGWMITTTVLFFFFSARLFKKDSMAFWASLMFVLLTTLPPFEGNIPNGELFVMGFVMVGAFIISFSNHFINFIEEKKVKSVVKDFTTKEISLLFFSGVFLGLGILTKVPALLDLAAFLAISWFIVTNSFTLKKKGLNKWFKSLPAVVIKTAIIFLGVLAPILLSIIYFVAIGSGKDYLDYGLLYNFRYSGSWQLSLGSVFLEKAFTLPGKAALLTIFILVLTFGKKFFTPKFQFIASWFGLALFATLLSNRPYPHYFMQVMPAFSLLFTYSMFRVIQLIRDIFGKKTKKSKTLKTHGKLEIVLSAFVIYISINILIVMNVGLYPTVSYYNNFHQMISGQITKNDYDSSFNYLVDDNKKITKIINDLGIREIFIWGTNPMLYAKSKAVPSSRYTVSFHIKDFDAYDETFEIVKDHQPKIIVVMKEEDYEFKALNEYLNENYSPGVEYDHMVLYLRNGL